MRCGERRASAFGLGCRSGVRRQRPDLTRPRSSRSGGHATDTLSEAPHRNLPVSVTTRSQREARAIVLPAGSSITIEWMSSTERDVAPVTAAARLAVTDH